MAKINKDGLGYLKGLPHVQKVWVDGEKVYIHAKKGAVVFEKDSETGTWAEEPTFANGGIAAIADTTQAAAEAAAAAAEAAAAEAAAAEAAAAAAEAAAAEAAAAETEQPEQPEQPTKKGGKKGSLLD